MKLRKITSMLAIALTIAIGTVTFGQGVYAAEISSSTGNTKIVQIDTKINSDTKITKENLKDVLKYVGLDPNNYIPDNSIDKSKEVKTVGALQKAIENAKKASKVTVVTNTSRNSTSQKANTMTSLSTNSAYGGGVGLSSSLQVGDSYIVTISATGQYNDIQQWSGVTGLSASVDTAGTTAYTYKVAPGADLRATWTPGEITVKSYVTINTYLAIESGFTLVSYQGVSGTDTYDATDYYSQME